MQNCSYVVEEIGPFSHSDVEEDLTAGLFEFGNQFLY